MQHDGLATDTALARMAKDIAYGSAAGMTSKVFEHPFDLTKVRLQAQVLDRDARFSGPMDCLTQTWKREGFRGLYRGLPAPVVGAMAENATLFLSYNAFQTLLRRAILAAPDQPLALSQLTLAAGGAGAVTSFILTPIELVKCKMQVQMLIPHRSLPSSSTRRPKLPGPIAVLKNVMRTTGLRGLWLGHTGTLIRETGGGAAWFGTKEYVASLLLARRATMRADASLPPLSDGAQQRAHPDLLPWESALSGACAGAAFNLVLFPADTVKSVIQTEAELRPVSGSGHARRGAGFGETLVAMYRAGGVRGLYAGCGITVVRSVPSSAIIFLIYDGLNKYMT